MDVRTSNVSSTLSASTIIAQMFLVAPVHLPVNRWDTVFVILLCFFSRENIAGIIATCLCQYWKYPINIIMLYLCISGIIRMYEVTCNAYLKPCCTKSAFQITKCTKNEKMCNKLWRLHVNRCVISMLFVNNIIIFPSFYADILKCVYIELVVGRGVCNTGGRQCVWFWRCDVRQWMCHAHDVVSQSNTDTRCISFSMRSDLTVHIHSR